MSFSRLFAISAVQARSACDAGIITGGKTGCSGGRGLGTGIGVGLGGTGIGAVGRAGAGIGGAGLPGAGGGAYWRRL